METIAKLAPMTPDLYFEVYGGNEGDISRWREACSSIKNIKLHGHILHEDVGARMADCDILIAPYSSQVQHSGKGDIGRWMSPLKLFEYMAAARPMLVSDLPVVREVLQDGKSALMCTPDDVESFAKALRLLAADPDLRGRLGRAARRKLEEEYTWDIRARRVLQGIEVAGVG
jgi:glycosyltransferase involved in cell wall biosynthesis